MSLEQELMRNTEALVALTAALSRSFPVAGSGDTTGLGAGQHTKIPKAKVTPENQMTKVTPAEIEALKEVEPPKPVVAATPPETSPAAPTSDAPAAVEYADVAAAITAVFKTDRARVMQALANFGAAKGPQLKPADYAAFLKELAA